MATLLYRLGRTAYRRWPAFLVGWLVVLVAVGALAGALHKPMSDQMSIPGIPSEKAAELQKELFPKAVNAAEEINVNVVVAAPKGHTLTEDPYAGAVAQLVGDLRALPQLRSADTLAGPVEMAAAQSQQLVQGSVAAGMPQAQAEANAQALSPLSKDGRIGTISFDFDVTSPGDVTDATHAKLDSALQHARSAGLSAEANGTGAQAAFQAGGSAEVVGILVALGVLLLTFGSLVAAGLPILTALVGVGVGVGGIEILTRFMDLTTTTPLLATMIGLAVGIDYTLFILARYRSELERTKGDREEAVGIAVGTAGTAVVFAGLTVLIALAFLSVIGIPFLGSMGIAAAATVLVAVLVALTLLPAVLGLLKSKAFGGRIRKYQPKREADGRVVNNGTRWARFVRRWPIPVAIVSVLLLCGLALPVRDLHLALPSDSTAAANTSARKASDLMGEAFGPGREGPLLVVVDARQVDQAQRPAAFGQVVAWAAGQDGVANAQVVGQNADGTGAQVLIQPTTGPDDKATATLLSHLRDGQSSIESKSGTTIGVTGLTAIQTDVSDKLGSALPIYLAIVIGLAFVLLVLVFRSILVPLTATLGFLLSVLATLGVTVQVFQKGTGGLVPGEPIISFMPVFLIGVVFGLAMDYQVFLVTRVREAHVHGMHMRDAVVDGFRQSARVVAAAATIMTAVFAAFILMDEPIIKSMGFALAAAVVLDAFVVRMALIPALLFLLGDKAWWLPRWLDRILPNVDVEGEKLPRPYAAEPTAELEDAAAH
jgi:putative drug exporter of the RND superfamily